MNRYQPGDHVKVEFKDDHTGESEWMWVKVDYCDDRNGLVFGWLDNEPVVHAGKLKLGQHLAVSYDNICEHRKPQDFRSANYPCGSLAVNPWWFYKPDHARC